MYYEIYSSWRARLIRDLADFLTNRYGRSNIGFIIVCTGSGANTNYIIASTNAIENQRKRIKEEAGTFVSQYDI